MAEEVYSAVGRRKSSVARVRLLSGNGAVNVNNKTMAEFFPRETMRFIVTQPLVLTNTAEKFNVIANVNGGGISGQAGAIRHGISGACSRRPGSSHATRG